MAADYSRGPRLRRDVKASRFVRRSAAVAMALAVVCLSGCAIPTDPNGSLERIDGGTLHAGATEHAGLVTVAGGEVAGPLADLIEGFAAEHDASVDWTIDGEESLVDDLEAGRLDLAIGDMTDATPWVDRVSVTRAYSTIDGSDGESIVVLLPLGENALQSALESYLDREVGP